MWRIAAAADADVADVLLHCPIIFDGRRYASIRIFQSLHVMRSVIGKVLKNKKNKNLLLDLTKKKRILPSKKNKKIKKVYITYSETSEYLFSILTINHEKRA